MYAGTLRECTDTLAVERREHEEQLRWDSHHEREVCGLDNSTQVEVHCRKLGDRNDNRRGRYVLCVNRGSFIFPSPHAMFCRSVCVRALIDHHLYNYYLVMTGCPSACMGSGANIGCHHRLGCTHPLSVRRRSTDARRESYFPAP